MMNNTTSSKLLKLVFSYICPRLTFLIIIAQSVSTCQVLVYIFDISVLYYKVGNDLCVESVDEDFDYKLPVVKHIDMTFKYPCQGDYETIIAQNAYKSPDKMTLIDVMQMELTRLVVLIRKWSLDAEFTRMVELDTKIVKAIANKVREKIGVKGIL